MRLINRKVHWTQYFIYQSAKIDIVINQKDLFCHFNLPCLNHKTQPLVVIASLFKVLLPSMQEFHTEPLFSGKVKATCSSLIGLGPTHPCSNQKNIWNERIFHYLLKNITLLKGEFQVKNVIFRWIWLVDSMQEKILLQNVYKKNKIYPKNNLCSPP